MIESICIVAVAFLKRAYVRLNGSNNVIVVFKFALVCCSRGIGSHCALSIAKCRSNNQSQLFMDDSIAIKSVKRE